MRCTSVKSSVVIAGLNAPPHGTALDGPASPPDGASTPEVKLKAEARSIASRARSSCPVTTDIDAGTRAARSGIRVAVTTIASSADAAAAAQPTKTPLSTASTAAARRIRAEKLARGSDDIDDLYVAKSWPAMSRKDLNSSAFPDGSSKKNVACSPG